MDQRVARGQSSGTGALSLRRPWSAGGHAASSLAVLAMLADSASLAVRPRDTIEDRDGNSFGEFFLGVAHPRSLRDDDPARRGTPAVRAAHTAWRRARGAALGTLPQVTWTRQIEIGPRVRGFKLQFNEADVR